jgi:hypothetical protein
LLVCRKIKHRQLKARAALSGLPLSDYLIREVRKIAEYPSPEEMRERLRLREPYNSRKSPRPVPRKHWATTQPYS